MKKGHQLMVAIVLQKWPQKPTRSTVITHDHRAVTTAANRSHDGMDTSILSELSIKQLKDMW